MAKTPKRSLPSVRVPADQYDRIDALVRQRRMTTGENATVTDIMREAVDRYLAAV